MRISQNSQEIICVRVSFLIKLQASGLNNFIKKKTLAQLFSCKFCKVFKNTFFTEQTSFKAERFVKMHLICCRAYISVKQGRKLLIVSFKLIFFVNVEVKFGRRITMTLNESLCQL